MEKKTKNKKPARNEGPGKAQNKRFILKDTH